MRKIRRILLGGLALVVLAAAAVTAWFVLAWTNAIVDTVGEVDFQRPLAVPPLADSRVDDRGRRVFDLTLQRGEADFGRGAPTPTWGINGDYLGPTLRARRGEEVLVHVANEVGEDSTLHWHGMHLPAAMDGGPHQMIDDGDTWSPTWTVDQPASTLWYHPHPHGRTAEHVYRGLAGMFLIEDDHDVALPSTYGVDDIPLIVQDKKFDGSELDESTAAFHSTGILGDHVLVNGTPGPYLEVTTQRVRLRVLNASNARIYHFSFSDDRPFELVGTDGGLLREPLTMSSLPLSPGERAELVVDMSPGEDVVLRSLPLEDSGGRFAGAEDSLDVLQLRAADALAPSPEVPETLAAEAPDLADDRIAETREFRLSGTQINGKDMDMSRIDETVGLDTTELWKVHNADGQPHNFHVHDVQFQVTSYDGGPPPGRLTGWKDTVFLPPGVDAELRVRFTDYADADTPYMFHCHLLLHEDRGMMGQFVVVEAGQEAADPGGGEHHGH